MGNIKLRMTPAKLRKPPCKNFYWFVSNRFFHNFIELATSDVSQLF
jgi:hypothetical protein